MRIIGLDFANLGKKLLFLAVFAICWLSVAVINVQGAAHWSCPGTGGILREPIWGDSGACTRRIKTCSSSEVAYFQIKGNCSSNGTGRCFRILDTATTTTFPGNIDANTCGGCSAATGTWYSYQSYNGTSYVQHTKTCTWVPNTVPVLTLSKPVNNVEIKAGGKFLEITGTVADADVEALAVSYRLNNDSWTSLTNLNTTTRTFTVNLDIESLLDGAYILEVKANDGTVDSSIVTRNFSINRANMEITSTIGNNVDGIEIRGNVIGNEVNQNLVITADACNTAGECRRQTVTVMSGDPVTTKDFTLTWPISSLPVGVYDGTIWVQMLAETDYYSAESEKINFEITSPERILNLSVIKNQDFVLNLGSVATFNNLVVGTDQEVTLANQDGKALVSGNLSADTTVTFGSVQFVFRVVELPLSTVKNVTLY